MLGVQASPQSLSIQELWNLTVVFQIKHFMLLLTWNFFPDHLETIRKRTNGQKYVLQTWHLLYAMFVGVKPMQIIPMLRGQQDVMMQIVLKDPAPAKKPPKEFEHPQFQEEDPDPNMDLVTESTGPFDEVDFISLHGVDPMIHGDGSEKGSHHYAPPDFFNRPAFKSLSEKGLAVIPAEQGYMLSYHSKTYQWHARCVCKDANMAPTWGAKRTEEQALCLAIERLWKWFVEENPDDEEGVLRLEKIREHLKQIGS